MPAAPIPWIARPAMKRSIFCTTAHIRLPAKNMMTDISMMGFRPQMSDTAPHIGVLTVCARMKALPIHVYPASDPNEATIVGSAVVTIVTSKAATRTLKQREKIVNISSGRECFFESAALSAGSVDGSGAR